jgi:TolB-like protein/tetratricopeptide (TPR) repeat protein
MMMSDSNPKAPNTRSDGEWLEGICQNGISLSQYHRASETFTDASASGTSRSVIQPKHRASISDSAIRDELARIIESSIFVQSERLGRFLRFTVETTLDGKAETLKEYLIGTHVYGRKPSYQPTEDSIVRSEARRLRLKLKEFYETIGKRDLIVIRYRPGSYVPAFQMQHEGSGSPMTISKPGDAVSEKPELRVAVLPFVDLSRGALSAACARLLTDDLVHELVRAEGVLLTTAFSERPDDLKAMDISSVAKTPDVDIVFEGTVGEDGNQLRVAIRIITPSGLRIWSEKFETDRDPQRLFDISARIASTLISRICPVQPLIGRRAAPARTLPLSVHPLVLRAEELLDEGTLAATKAALAKWQEVIEIDPFYARAFCGVAQSYCEMALRGVADSAASISNANHAAERAAQLASDHIEVAACSGSALALSWKWREAEASFHKALALGGHGGTYRQYAVLLAALGRFGEAWNYAQKAQQIDPFSHRQKVIYTRLLYLTRNYEDGLKYISEQLLYGRVPYEAELYRALMLTSGDRRDEAGRIAHDLLEKVGTQPAMMSGVAEILAMCGEMNLAGRIASDYKLFAQFSAISKFRQALLALALGDCDDAIHLLSAAYEEHEAELIWLACDPRLDTIRKDPRFTALLDGVMLGGDRLAA